MIRWLAVIVLAVAAASTILATAWLGESVRSLEERRSNLQGKASELMRLKKDREELARRMEEWQDLLVRAGQASMAPDMWYTNPLEGVSEMQWQELNGLVRLLSSAHPLDTGYWYRPETFRLQRVEKEDLAMTVDEASLEGQASTSTSYTLRVRGTFYIPR